RVLEEKADRHELHAEARERLDRFAVHRDGATGNPEHRRDRRAVDVRVEKARAPTRAVERERDVRRARALADAPLPAHDEDDVLPAGERIGAADGAAGELTDPPQLDGADARDLRDGLADALAERLVRTERGAGALRGCEGDGEIAALAGARLLDPVH